MHPGLVKFNDLSKSLKVEYPTALVRRTFEEWVNEDKSSYKSDISDNHIPYEFSIANDGDQPELRLLFEVQGHEPSLSSNYERACAFNNELIEWGASLDRFDIIKEMYRPTSDSARFGLWHAYCFRNDAPPDIKLYMNPQAHGKKHAFVITAATMARLGFDDAYKHLFQKENTEIKYLSLDLTSNLGARLKVYTAHFSAFAKEIEETLSCANNYVPNQISDFCKFMGETVGPYDKLPVQTCLSFTAGNKKPTSGAVHFPIRAYADNDLISTSRLFKFLGEDDKGVHVVNGFSGGIFEKQINKLAYVSLRQYAGPHRTTVYLSV